jgi:hypothetical protein
MKCYFNQGAYVLLLFVCLISCDKKKAMNQDRKIEVSASLGGSYILNQSTVILIVGKVRNVSNEMVSFLSMGCSVENTWRCSNVDFELGLKLCYSDVPVLVKLKPNESVTFFLNAKAKKPFDELANQEFNIGFNFVEADTLIFNKALRSIAAEQNIVWAKDTFKLNDLVWRNTIKLER